MQSATEKRRMQRRVETMQRRLNNFVAEFGGDGMLVLVRPRINGPSQPGRKARISRKGLLVHFAAGTTPNVPPAALPAFWARAAPIWRRHMTKQQLQHLLPRPTPAENDVANDDDDANVNDVN